MNGHSDKTVAVAVAVHPSIASSGTCMTVEIDTCRQHHVADLRGTVGWMATTFFAA